MLYTDKDRVKAAIAESRLSALVPEYVDTKIDSAIMAASAEMDIYISRNYDIPLDTVISSLNTEQEGNITELLSRLCIALTLFILIPQGSTGVPKGIQISYDRAMARLRELSKGFWILPYISPKTVQVFQVIGDRESTLTYELFDLSRIV